MRMRNVRLVESRPRHDVPYVCCCHYVTARILDWVESGTTTAAARHNPTLIFTAGLQRGDSEASTSAENRLPPHIEIFITLGTHTHTRTHTHKGMHVHSPRLYTVIFRCGRRVRRPRRRFIASSVAVSWRPSPTVHSSRAYARNWSVGSSGICVPHPEFLEFSSLSTGKSLVNQLVSGSSLSCTYSYRWSMCSTIVLPLQSVLCVTITPEGRPTTKYGPHPLTPPLR